MMHIKGFKSPENKALPFVAEGLSVDRPVRFVMKVHTDIFMTAPSQCPTLESYIIAALM